MKMIIICLMGWVCIFATDAVGQTLQLKGTNAFRKSLAINEVLHNYQVIQLEQQLPEVKRITQVELQLDTHYFSIPVQAFTGNIENVMVIDAKGSQTLSKLTIWRGQNAQKEKLNLAINKGFVMGELTQNGQQWTMEQACNLDSSFSNDFLILYRPEDVKKKDVFCGVKLERKLPAAAFGPKLHTKTVDTKQSSCRTIEYAIAADFTSFQRHGGLQQTANYIMGIMNLVGTNFSGVFNDDFQFRINQILVYTSHATNPWPPTIDISENQSDFFNEAPNLFSLPFDVCSYWFSTLGFSNGMVGLSNLQFTCNGRSSNVIREYGAPVNSIRVLVAHEIGHNLSAGHDSSVGFIMSPMVTNATNWSTKSVASVNNWMDGKNTDCFIACNNTFCDTALLGGASIMYDTASNQIRVRWTQVPGELVRIRWLKKSMNVWDSITSADLNGQFNINNACDGSWEYRVEILKLCNATAFALNYATWVLTAAHQPYIDFGNSTFMPNGTSKLLVSRFQQSGYQYNWYIGEKLLLGENEPTLKINTEGTYRLDLNNGNGCWFSSAEVTLIAAD